MRFLQVEGCAADLSILKQYYQRHRICINHFKLESMEVGGKMMRCVNSR